LHWKTCRFLVQNFDVILLATFETRNMVLKCRRKIRKKSVRSLLTFSRTGASPIRDHPFQAAPQGQGIRVRQGGVGC